LIKLNKLIIKINYKNEKNIFYKFLYFIKTFKIYSNHIIIIMRTSLIILILLIILLICTYRNDFINISGLSRINEPFFDEKSDLINSLSEKLSISTRRIVDLEYGFIPEGSKNLVVRFSILPKHSSEPNEPSVEELQGTINHLFETNNFIINYRDELITLESNSNVSFNSNSSDSFNNTMNNVKPKEEFNNYQCDVDPKFDNINLLKAKKIVESTYRNFPLDESLTRFIEIENKDGRIKSFNTPTTCNN
jgi:hypothetical protein